MKAMEPELWLKLLPDSMKWSQLYLTRPAARFKSCHFCDEGLSYLMWFMLTDRRVSLIPPHILRCPSALSKHMDVEGLLLSGRIYTLYILLLLIGQWLHTLITNCSTWQLSTCKLMSQKLSEMTSLNRSDLAEMQRKVQPFKYKTISSPLLPFADKH